MEYSTWNPDVAREPCPRSLWIYYNLAYKDICPNPSKVRASGHSRGNSIRFIRRAILLCVDIAKEKEEKTENAQTFLFEAGIYEVSFGDARVLSIREY